MVAWTQDLHLRDRTQGWGPRRSQGRRPGWGSQPESLWALYPNMEGFFGLHLSHPGHGPRDLLSRYCRQDCASPAGPSSSPSWPSQHLPKLQSRSSPPAGSSTPLTSTPASIEESPRAQQIQETHIPSAACNQPVSARLTTHYYLPSNCCVLVPGAGTTGCESSGRIWSRPEFTIAMAVPKARIPVNTWRC